jgi:hypothetical protein
MGDVGSRGRHGNIQAAMPALGWLWRGTRNAKDFADVPGLRWVNWFSN